VNSTSLKLFNHFLGETAMAIYGTQTLAAQFRKGFPGSLEGAPFLLPTESSTTRRALEAYFDQIGVRPNFVGEFDDSALLKSFAEGGLGLFAAPLVIQNELRRQYGFHKLGLAQGIKERFYAVTGERKIKQPALVVITDAARERLFRFTSPRKLKE
jgi:LysR family transcriptional activator of nhaA